jgi:hypothetical protein
MLTCGPRGCVSVFDGELVSFLEGGSAFIVGFVTPDGAPLASRGWGLDVLDAAAGIVRVLLVPDDIRVAVTGAHVLTLRSVQLKGVVEALEDETPEMWARCARYCDDFFGIIEAVDRFPRAMMERTTPVRIAACTVAVEEMFDQTPGPGAGAAIARSAP